MIPRGPGVYGRTIDMFDNSASLLDPVPPPGFRLDHLRWSPEAHQFDGRDIWLGIVTAACLMAQFDIDEPVRQSQAFRFAPSRIYLIFHVRAHATRGTLVWAFWELGRQIATHYPMPRKVPSFKAEVQSSLGVAGSLELGLPGAGSAGPFNSSDNDPLAPSGRRDAIMSSGLRIDQGTVVCIDDRGLLIHYVFEGRQLLPGEVFTAFLTAQTFVSAHKEEESDVDMVALSHGQHVRISLKRVTPAAAGHLFTWRLARIGMNTVWREIVMGYNSQATRYVGPMRWESVSFRFEYRGVTVGRGSLDWSINP